MIDITKLEEGFEELLGRRNYDLWFTGTFRRQTNEYTAIKKYKKFFKNLNKPCDIYFKDRIYCWVFVEKKPWDDKAHIHALIDGIDPSNAKHIEEKWEDKLGEAKVDPYDYTLEMSAIKYLAHKYADRHELGWLKIFEFFKINSRWRIHKKVYSCGLNLEAEH